MFILKLKKQTKIKIDMIKVKNYVPQLVFRCFQHRSKFLSPNYQIPKKIILAHSIRAKKTYLRTTGDTPIEYLYCVTLPNMVPPKGPIIIHHILLVNEEITVTPQTPKGLKHEKDISSTCRFFSFFPF